MDSTRGVGLNMDRSKAAGLLMARPKAVGLHMDRPKAAGLLKDRQTDEVLHMDSPMAAGPLMDRPNALGLYNGQTKCRTYAQTKCQRPTYEQTKSLNMNRPKTDAKFYIPKYPGTIHLCPGLKVNMFSFKAITLIKHSFLVNYPCLYISIL